MADAPGASSTFKDIDGSYSSKRIAAFIALSVYILGGVVDVVMGTVRVPPEVMQGFLYITLGGLSLAVGERFAPRGDHDDVH